MPPKKADPEAQKKEFQVYRESEEWKKIEQCYREMKGLTTISETSKDYDIDGKYQLLWDRLYELAVVMKIKPPFKKIEHEWIRSIYFGEKRKTQSKDPPCVFDGVLCEYDPVEGDSQHNLRQALIKKIYNLISDLDSYFDIDNYTKSRGELKKGFTQFFNLMKSHLKKSFKVIFEDKLLVVLKPFSDLLEVNMKLVLHELKYSTKDEQFINQFKHNAIVDRYCQCLEKVIEILSTHHSRKVKFAINPRNIFKKLLYTDSSKIEKFYLAPYRKAFDTMKQGLCALFATGMNFWKVPIENNRKFVEDLCNLINWELILERFFGNDLLRDQMSFIANVLTAISKANDLSDQFLKKLDLNSIELSVPRLVAFKTIKHMRSYKDKLADIRQREMEHAKMTGTTATTEQEIHPNPVMTSTKVTVVLAATTSFIPKEKSSFEQEIDQLGRYWIWDNYCQDNFRDKVIEEAVEMLRHINPAVHQDIQDSIIREGMLPRKERQNEELKVAAQTLKQMKTIDNSLKAENMRRPPQLWNFPKVTEEEHKFRSIAQPKKCYVDGRIGALDALINQIGDYLRKHNHKEWSQLIRRGIDFISDHPDPNPFTRSVEES